jgi:hypothetical protein
MVDKTKPTVIVYHYRRQKIGERLPQLERKCYTFEANDQTELPKLIAQLVEKCVNCIEQGKGKTSGGQ